MAQPAQIEQPTPNKIEPSAHSYDSTLREQALGHIFLGELLAFMWRHDRRDIEMLDLLFGVGPLGHVAHDEDDSAAVDRRQRDLLRERAAVRAAAGHFTAPPSALFHGGEDDVRETLDIERFYWYGGRPGTPLPDLGKRIARHSKGNSQGEKNERPGHRVVAKRDFDTLVNISEVVGKLFG